MSLVRMSDCVVTCYQTRKRDSAYFSITMPQGRQYFLRELLSIIAITFILYLHIAVENPAFQMNNINPPTTPILIGLFISVHFTTEYFLDYITAWLCRCKNFFTFSRGSLIFGLLGGDFVIIWALWKMKHIEASRTLMIVLQIQFIWILFSLCSCLEKFLA